MQDQITSKSLKLSTKLKPHRYTITRWWCHRREHPGSTNGCFRKSSLFGVNSQSLIDNYECFLLLHIVGSTQKAPIIFYKAKLNGNSNHFSYFSRKHPWVLPGCFLLWHHQRVIVYVPESYSCFHQLDIVQMTQKPFCFVHLRKNLHRYSHCQAIFG